MENENFCGGNCARCEKFTEEAPTLAESEVGVPTSPKESVGKESETNRSKEDKDEEKLFKLVRELKEKQEKEEKKYKKKKYK